MHWLKLTAKHFPKQVEPYIRFIELMLTPTRFQHCLGVAKSMEKAFHGGLGWKFGELEPQTTEADWITAGLLHDVLKEASVPTMLWWLRTYEPDWLDKIPKPLQDCPTYLHGPAGAAYIKHAIDFEKRPKKFYLAIVQHAGEYPGMSVMARCLHVADMCSPTMPFQGYDKLARLFFQGRLSEAEMLLDAWIIESVGDFGVPIHPQYFVRLEELKNILKPSEDFFSRTGP